MPPTPASVVEQWQNLPRAVLQDKVRQVVKRRDAEAKQIWAHVRANSVLAAQVRGALSALRAEVRGTRDEVMWTMWIDQARSVLDASPEKASPEKASPEKAAQAEKPAADKPAAEKPAPDKVVAEKAADEKKPAPVAELTFTPQPVEKPRTAPPVVPPVMFQAPGT
ncbi:hypothetical protein [Kutzneria kofuensis]|uniref:Membrane protein involved in colicin uptake n=1 Tax=Kutzneria kofuensis TaxID=103725 RepID=A0A7W9KP04_9PSEU|nr:hypothetical protein [Kutzneria kofuensis]MBB5895339.1 membrane protein involved in colicin uptake [Kutzneria kofuensis]